ncbi:unnamed protein product [Vicia faba]|uniref:Uncharacterized protein n=1 Tax=Vicia faba TaxID=3906 RepID=A0AAV1AQH0_VICFA|nr:unnamed protein product [Vicia faba]
MKWEGKFWGTTHSIHLLWSSVQGTLCFISDSRPSSTNSDVIPSCQASSAANPSYKHSTSISFTILFNLSVSICQHSSSSSTLNFSQFYTSRLFNISSLVIVVATRTKDKYLGIQIDEDPMVEIEWSCKCLVVLDSEDDGA